MIKFKLLFSFAKSEIPNLIAISKLKTKQSGFKLLQVDTKELEYGKILIVTSRKTGKAHDRNLIRRRIKEAFHTQKLYEKPVISILFVYKSALALSYAQIKDFLFKNI